MKHLLLYALFVYIGIGCCRDTALAPYTYAVAETPWNEALGNHRAVLAVDAPAEVVKLSFDWRRPDKEVENRRFLIVDAETGIRSPTSSDWKSITNNVSFCLALCQKKGTYFFYYLPYLVQEGHGNYHRGYYPKEEAPDRQWLAVTSSGSSVGQLPEATIVRVESRTQFDSFYPMEVAASASEKESYRQTNPDTFLSSRKIAHCLYV